MPIARRAPVPTRQTLQLTAKRAAAAGLVHAQRTVGKSKPVNEGRRAQAIKNSAHEPRNPHAPNRLHWSVVERVKHDALLFELLM